MIRDYFVSVALATYNGEKYIKQQLESILCRLNDNDEIIVSDDGSTDNTINIIKSFNDKRIKLINGPHDGVKKNFANAISYCSGKYIFLSDQDDIWCDDKLKKVLNTFEKNNCLCVMHDAIIIDSNENIIMNSFYKFRNSKSGVIKNIIKNSYIGCCMAFDRSIVKSILPIPNNIEMHDQWIGLIAEKLGKSIFIDDKLIKYRRHDNNQSKMKHYPISKMIKNRIVFIHNYINVIHYFKALYYRFLIIINEIKNFSNYKKLKIKDRINYVSGSKISKINYENKIRIIKGFDIFNLYKNECQILTKLNSIHFPKIIKIEDNYFIEEYINGLNLTDFCKKNILTKEIYLNMINDAVLILDELKQNKIIHRDIRPENIIVDDNGHLKLIDFGGAIDLNKPFVFNERIETTLGIEYKKYNEWDDAFSFYKVLSSLNYLDKDHLNCIIERIGVLVYKG